MPLLPAELGDDRPVDPTPVSSSDPASWHATPSTASVVTLRALCDAVDAAGGSSDALLASLSVDRSALEHWLLRVPMATLIAAWDAAPRLTHDDAFGLHMAPRLRVGAFGLVEYAARASKTLEDGLRRISAYQHLLYDQIDCRVTVDGDLATLSYTLHRDAGVAPRHFAEATLSTWLLHARAAINVDFTPTLVTFRHPRPASTAEHTRIFRCPIEFGAPVDGLTVETRILRQRLPTADDNLAHVLDDAASLLLERLPRAGDVVSVTRRLLLDAVASGGHPHGDAVAASMGTSFRTLQRRLHEAGTSFRKVLDDVRKQLVLEQVEHGDLSNTDLALRLGYSGPTALHHAFKRWTGQSLGQAREQQKAR